MSVEAVGESAGVEERELSEEAMSQWNGREVQSPFPTKEAAIVRALALFLIGTELQGLRPVYSVEQGIYELGELSEEELFEELEVAIVEAEKVAHLDTPLLTAKEEHIRALLHDPTRFKEDLLLLYRHGPKHSIGKLFRKIGKEIKKGVKKVGEFCQDHKKEAVAVVILAAGVTAIALTGGAASAPVASATAAATAALANREFEKKSKGSSGGASKDPEPPDVQKLKIDRPAHASSQLQAPIVPQTKPFFSQASSTPLTSLGRPASLSKQSAVPQLPEKPFSSYRPWELQEKVFLQPPPAVPITSRSYPMPTPSSPGKPPAPVLVFDPDGPVRAYNLPEQPSIKSSKFVTEGTRHLKRGAIGGVNGIGNNLDSAKGHAKYLSSLGQNVQVDWVHNNSNTIFVDALEAVFVNPIYAAPAKLLIENWTKFHEEHKNDPGAKYLQFCHSQGALDVKNGLLKAPKEIRDRIIVVAIAPATVIPKTLCFNSFNYASRADPIPFLETNVLFASELEFAPKIAEELRRELIILEKHPDASFPDHEFQSPTYKQKIKEHLEEYLNQN
jgi:hypothetical protein